MGRFNPGIRACIIATLVMSSSANPLFARNKEAVTCGIYTVTRGDSLSAIINRGPNGLTVAQIVAANADVLQDPDQIAIGMTLTIPCQDMSQKSACDIKGKEEETNMADIDESLCKTFEDQKTSPDFEAQVIVTFNDKVDPELLGKAGFNVVSELNNLPVVIGSLKSEGLDILANSESVKRIEQDSDGMRALDN